MPYRKRFRRRRRRGRRSGYSLKRKVNLALARSKPEDKFLNDIKSQVVTTPTAEGVIPDISQDVTSSGRIGNKIFAKRAMYHFEIFWNTSSTQLFSTIRFIFVKWWDSTLPAYTDIMRSSSLVTSFYNVGNATRFKILYDRKHMVGKQGNANAVKYFNVSIKMNQLLVFDGDAAVGASNVRYALLMIGNDTNGPTLSYSRRFVYTDA